MDEPDCTCWCIGDDPLCWMHGDRTHRTTAVVDLRIELWPTPYGDRSHWLMWDDGQFSGALGQGVLEKLAGLFTILGLAGPPDFAPMTFLPQILKPGPRCPKCRQSFNINPEEPPPPHNKPRSSEMVAECP